MDQVSSIYNPGNDFFWREEGPRRARARTSPARPSLGVPPTRFGGFPVTLSGQTRLNLQVSVRLGQPAWFAPIGWTGTSRSQVGVPPRMSTFLIWQAHSKNKMSLYRFCFANQSGSIQSIPHYSPGVRMGEHPGLPVVRIGEDPGLPVVRMGDGDL